MKSARYLQFSTSGFTDHLCTSAHHVLVMQDISRAHVMPSLFWVRSSGADDHKKVKTVAASFVEYVYSSQDHKICPYKPLRFARVL